MRLVEKALSLLGYERKSNRIYEASSRGWSGGAYSGQDLSSNAAAYRYVLWTYICVKAISEDIAGLPLRFYTGQGKAKKEVTDHFIATLFSAINPNSSPYEFWLRIVAGYELLGSAWAGIEKNNAGRPAEIYALISNRVKVLPDADDFIAGVEYQINGQIVKYAKDELLWIKSFNPDNEYYGLSPVEPAKDTLIAELNSRAYQKAYFKNDATPPGFLVAKNKLKSDSRERFDEGYREKHEGVENAGKIGVLQGEWSYIKTGDSIKDMQYEKLRKMNREDILGCWGVPPGRAGINEYSNYANLEAQLKLYWHSTLLPISRAICSSVNSNFLPRYDKKLWCAHDTSQVEALQENQQTKSSIAVSLHDSGIFTANEIRDQYYNMPPHPDGDELKSNAGAIPGFDSTKQYVQAAVEIHLKAQDSKLKRWAIKDLRRRQHEVAMMHAMADFLDDQRKRVLKSLENLPEGHLPVVDEVEIFFDDLKEKEVMTEVSVPLIKDAVEKSGQAALEELQGLKTLSRKNGDEESEIVGVFDMENPRVTAWMERNSAQLVTEVTDTTKRKIRKLVAQANREGWPVQQLADAINEKLSAISPERAWTIAQTEMGAATNAGAMEGYRQGGAKKKEWLDTPDEKTRDSHREAGAQGPIDLEDKFKVGSAYLDCPGDPSGPIEEIANCRCAVGPIIDGN